MSTRKNGVKEKLIAFYEELRRARSFLRDVDGVLSRCEEGTNLTRELGCFFHQMPELTIFQEQEGEFRQRLRMVCSGEIAPEDARVQIAQYIGSLEEVMNCINLEGNEETPCECECNCQCECVAAGEEDETPEETNWDPKMEEKNFYLSLHVEGSDAILALIEQLIERLT